MTENKWKLSNASNIILAVCLIFTSGLFFFLASIIVMPLLYIFSLGAAETGDTSAQKLILIIWMAIPILLIILGTCHVFCIPTENKVRKNGGFINKKQRRRIIFIMSLDIFIAVLFCFLVYLMFEMILTHLVSGILNGLIMSVAVIIFAIISAVCKSSIIKLPAVTPNQNNMSLNVPYNGAYNGAHPGSYNKPPVEKTVTDKKWVLFFISNVFFKIVFPVIAVLLLLRTLTSAEDLIDSRYFEIFNWVMPIFAAIYAICHIICHSAEKHIIKEGCFKKVGQRYGLTVVMVLDYILAFLALLLLGSDIFIVIRVGGSEKFLTGIIYVICVVVIFFAATSATYKASMIKSPVGTPKQNNGPYNGLNNDPFNGPQPPNPWNRY